MWTQLKSTPFCLVIHYSDYILIYFTAPHSPQILCDICMIRIFVYIYCNIVVYFLFIATQQVKKDTSQTIIINLKVHRLWTIFDMQNECEGIQVFLNSCTYKIKYLTPTSSVHLTVPVCSYFHVHPFLLFSWYICIYFARYCQTRADLVNLVPSMNYATCFFFYLSIYLYILIYFHHSPNDGCTNFLVA